jgi:hypothetical protein
MWNIQVQAILYTEKSIESMYSKVGLAKETKGGGKEGMKDSK